MNKIIFLDFDGVLNTEHYQGLLQYQGKPCKMNMVLILGDFLIQLFMNKIMLLNYQPKPYWIEELPISIAVENNEDI